MLKKQPNAAKNSAWNAAKNSAMNAAKNSAMNAAKNSARRRDETPRNAPVPSGVLRYHAK